jgi:hypothetical protein
VLVLGIAGLAVSLVGVAMQMLPRQFTAHQQQQILDWEAARLWRVLPAGTIFPAVVKYQPPTAVSGDGLSLSASRIGIARQASCRAATDPAVAAVLTRNRCQAMLRATYVDRTDSFVVTVGVAAFPGPAQAVAASVGLGGPTLTGAGGAPIGVRTVEFKNTPAGSFSNGRRQLSAQQRTTTYVIFYAIGYAGARPFLPVISDRYAYDEMTNLGEGVTGAVESALAPSLPQPHCPGTEGC